MKKISPCLYIIILLIIFSCGDSQKKYPEKLYIPIPFINPYRDFFKHYLYKYCDLNNVSSLNTSIYYDAVQTFINESPNAVRGVIIQKKPFDIIFIMASGKHIYFANGRFISQFNRDYSQLIYPYKKYNEKKLYHYRRIFLSNEIFDELYGDSPKNVRSNLVLVKIFIKNVQFNIQNNASAALTQAVLEIEIESETNPIVLEWINSIKTVYSYRNRTIAESNLKSLHSYGIALDFRYKNMYKKFEYWLWCSYFVEEWWNIDKKYIYQVPDKVVEIFASNGFVWGGYWNRFDTMHFEYRPEITKRKYFLSPVPEISDIILVPELFDK